MRLCGQQCELPDVSGRTGARCDQHRRKREGDNASVADQSRRHRAGCISHTLQSCHPRRRRTHTILRDKIRNYRLIRAYRDVHRDLNHDDGGNQLRKLLRGIEPEERKRRYYRTAAVEFDAPAPASAAPIRNDADGDLRYGRDGCARNRQRTVCLQRMVR